MTELSAKDILAQGGLALVVILLLWLVQWFVKRSDAREEQVRANQERMNAAMREESAKNREAIANTVGSVNSLSRAIDELTRNIAALDRNAATTQTRVDTLLAVRASRSATPEPFPAVRRPLPREEK